jgi:HAE1 family hydrophobic/amphiphilic exporter-1
VKDVATVELGHEKRRGFVRSFGHPSIAMNVIRQSGSNVVDIMDELRDRLDVVRAEILPNIAPEGYEAAGPHLRMRQVYDETTYIDSSIRLVTQNLFIGGAIAGVVLMLFLRSFVSTGIVAIAIPVSVIGTFLVLLALGRTLNVVSLAGLAFAVGWSSTTRSSCSRTSTGGSRGRPPARRGVPGRREVWGAILASTLTTAAVFIPVLTIQEEAGQLFRDIALAIVASVVLSLVVSITVIPAAGSRWLRPPKTRRSGFEEGLAASTVLRGLRRRVRERGRHWCMGGWRGWTVRPLVILGLTAASLGGAVLLAPPLDYLPAGNKNLVFGGLLIPPGLSVEYREEIAERIEAVASRTSTRTRRRRRSRRSIRSHADARGARRPPPPFDPVPMDNFFIGAFGSACSWAARAPTPRSSSRRAAADQRDHADPRHVRRRAADLDLRHRAGRRQRQQRRHRDLRAQTSTASSRRRG